jgi:type II secretory pathway pseudopilin PulG
MNLSDGPHHKIWPVAVRPLRAHRARSASSELRSEEGYTLVALLAVMTVLALFAMAAAPGIRQQSQREREMETIFRGEEVAEAIRVYHSYQTVRGRNGDAALPTSIDQLVEGLSSGTKKVQIPSAARDPLSDSGEWNLVRPRSSSLSDFQRSLLLYTSNFRPPTSDPQLRAVEHVMAPAVLPTLGIALSEASSADDDMSSAPFIGVASSSRSRSVIYYYGIDRHDGWIFTPLFR